MWTKLLLSLLFRKYFTLWCSSLTIYHKTINSLLERTQTNSSHQILTCFILQEVRDTFMEFLERENISEVKEFILNTITRYRNSTGTHQQTAEISTRYRNSTGTWDPQSSTHCRNSTGTHQHTAEIQQALKTHNHQHTAEIQQALVIHSY